MSTRTTARSQPQRSPEVPLGAVESRSAGRTVVASVIAGAVAALVLTLVVFPGATEATITGSMLLGFGFGWALMAALSIRRTVQPQRWAIVPADRHGRRRHRPDGAQPLERDPDHVELGVAAR